MARARSPLRLRSGSDNFTNKVGGFIQFQLDDAVGCPDVGYGGPYISSSTYGFCCFDTTCDIATSCNANNAYFTDQVLGCAGGGQCGTMTIFDSYPSPSQSWIFQDCFLSLAENTVYRTIQTTSSTSSATTSSTSTPASPSPTSGPAPTSSLNPATNPATNAAPVNNQRSSSKAWIAGAVIGPIAFVAAAGVLTFWFLRRKGELVPTSDPSDPRPISGQIGYVRSMPPALSKNN